MRGAPAPTLKRRTNLTTTPPAPADESGPNLALDEAAVAQLFTEARSANTFTDEPVTEDQLRAIYDLVKYPPTMANTNPLRILFVQSPAERARLVECMSDGNKAKTSTAPAVAVLAADIDFHEFMPQLFPARPAMKDSFAANEARRESQARFNAGLQIGYFILAVRAAGFAAGPMLGFDAAGVDAAFFAESRWRSLLVVNIGKPGKDSWFPRLPRLEWEQAVRLI